MLNRIGLMVALLAIASPVWAQDAGWIGVSVSDQKDRGVLVLDVQNDSPAAKSGLKANDVILEFNGQEVVGVLQLTRLVRETPAGRSVTVKFQRNDKMDSARVTTGRMPSMGAVRLENQDATVLRMPNMSALRDTLTLDFPDTQSSVSASQFGMRVDSMTPQLREYFGVPGNEGALVSWVDPQSAPGMAGLKAGDVIVAANGKRMLTPPDVFRELSASESVTFKIFRDKRSETIQFEIPAANRTRPGPRLQHLPSAAL
jgi:serine protease Do